MNKYDKLDDLNAALSVIEDKLRKKFISAGTFLRLRKEAAETQIQIKALEKTLNEKENM